MMRYMRPKIVIIENVQHAPWEKPKKTSDRTMREAVENQGYFAVATKVDTRDHGLPQTRNRVYMICIEQAQFEFRCDPALLQHLWPRLLHQMKRPASTSIHCSAWQKPRDNLLMIRAAEAHADIRKKMKAKATPWENCRVMHEVLRNGASLGVERPDTDWRSEDTFSLPNFYNKKMSGLVERILDSFDINFLRCISRGYDPHYYT